MRSYLSFVALAALLGVLVTAQDVFEEPRFNATEALVDLGIDVMKLPAELTEASTNVTKRTFDACRIAVSLPLPTAYRDE